MSSTAPPVIDIFSAHIKTQIHFLEITMEWNWQAEDARIQKGFAEARNVAGIEERQQAQKGERQTDADRSPSNADKERLGEQLAGNTTASRPQRDAYAQLAHAARRTGQQKIGGISAGDQ